MSKEKKYIKSYKVLRIVEHTMIHPQAYPQYKPTKYKDWKQTIKKVKRFKANVKEAAKRSKETYKDIKYAFRRKKK